MVSWQFGRYLPASSLSKLFAPPPSPSPSHSSLHLMIRLHETSRHHSMTRKIDAGLHTRDSRNLSYPIVGVGKSYMGERTRVASR